MSRMIGDVKVYERASEALISLSVDIDAAITQLLDSTQYENWLLGGSCSDICRIDKNTELIRIEFIAKRWWPLKP